VSLSEGSVCHAFNDVALSIEAALGAEMEHHLGYAKHEQNTQDIDIP
jgi:transposase-like protein